MKSLFGGSPLFRKIMASILLASVLFLSLLSIVAYYSNEIIEDELLARQTDFELQNIKLLLARDPQARLPRSASLSIYLASRATTQPIPKHLVDLAEGVYHDIKLDGKNFHVLVASMGDDRIYIENDITEIERSEGLLHNILLGAWVTLIVALFFIARILSHKLSRPIAQLSEKLSSINPDQRGIRLSDQFEDDEVGRIAQAFDSYTEKMDSYVEKQMAFAAMASHELRSPLTIIRTSADLIASRHDDPAINAHLEKIQRASANMANMIHALLAVTRDQPTENVQEAIALRPLVDEIIDNIKPEINAKRVKVENNLPRAVRVRADKTLITVVLINLIRNAVKHSEHSSIGIEMDDSHLSITDQGLGISSEDLQHIFDFGYRGQDSQGYGVGLYISKLICDYLGWSLHLEPNPQGGIIARVGFDQ
jgi:signal transduction histidine kinase